MKRKILAFILALTMLCPLLLTGCGKEAEETGDESQQETTTRATVSINMWVVTDNNDSEAAQNARARVEEEFNRITKSTFTTKVDLEFISADEYVQKLSQKIDAVDAAKKANSGIKNPTATTDSDTVAEEYELNENGVSVLKYPAISDDQLDIVFVQDINHLYDLVSANKLKNLNEHINATGKSKILTDIISESLLNHTKINESTYGIPNNRIFGEYTYLLINKDFVTGDKNGDGAVSSDEIAGSYINLDDLDSFVDCAELIEYIKANNPNVVPVLEKFDNPDVYFWGEDSSEFSILASKEYFNSQTKTKNDRYYTRNVFEIKEFTEFELLMKKYETQGYLAQDAAKAMEDKSFGVAVMSGDARIVDEYSENYYIKVLDTPAITDENISSTSFFAVTEYTKHLDRAMEVITMLNTNSELRNVLQYGVEGVHYELDENDRVYRFNNDYMMALEDTGNVFVAYPEEGMADDIWELGVQSNLDVRIHALTGLWIKMRDVDADVVANLTAASKAYKERMDACRTVEELEAFFATAKAEVNSDPAYTAAISSNPGSIRSIHSSWHDTLWPEKEEIA